MKRPDMVNINKFYIRDKVKHSGYRYVDIANLLKLPCDGSLTAMISQERMRLDILKQIARIVDFPYEEAIKKEKPKAYIIKQNKDVTKNDIDKIINMQIEINTTLMNILKKI